MWTKNNPRMELSPTTHSILSTCYTTFNLFCAVRSVYISDHTLNNCGLHVLFFPRNPSQMPISVEKYWVNHENILSITAQSYVQSVDGTEGVCLRSPTWYLYSVNSSLSILLPFSRCYSRHGQWWYPRGCIPTQSYGHDERRDGQLHRCKILHHSV